MTNFNWKIYKLTSSSRARTGFLTTPHGNVNTPAFIFCATKGALKTLPTNDKVNTNTQIMLFNIST